MFHNAKPRKMVPFQIRFNLGVPFQIIKNGKSCCVGFLFSLHVRGLLLVFCLLCQRVWMFWRSRRGDDNHLRYFLLGWRAALTRKNRALTSPVTFFLPSWLLAKYIHWILTQPNKGILECKERFNLRDEKSDFPFRINLLTLNED